jgi:hypothetical protein
MAPPLSESGGLSQRFGKTLSGLLDQTVNLFLRDFVKQR